MRLILKEVVLVCGMGFVAGSAAALTMCRLVEKMVFQMKAANPLIEGAAALILLVVAMSAAWMPAPGGADGSHVGPAERIGEFLQSRHFRVRSLSPPAHTG
jgi:hypothetical protein